MVDLKTKVHDPKIGNQYYFVESYTGGSPSVPATRFSVVIVELERIWITDQPETDGHSDLVRYDLRVVSNMSGYHVVGETFNTMSGEFYEVDDEIES